MNIVLIGLIGSGKTSIGKKIAKIIHFDFIDLDTVVVNLHRTLKNEHMTCQDIFEKYGDKYFRNLESKAVKEISHMKNCIIATGGGTLENRKNAEILKLNNNNKIIFLDVDINILAKRIREQPKRPIFGDSDPLIVLRKMDEKRSAFYRHVSDCVIDCSSSTIDEVVCQILEVLP